MTLGVFLEPGTALGTGRLTAFVGTHLDLHPDFFDEKLLHDTPAELEQRFDIEGLHTPVKAEPAGVLLSECISKPDGEPVFSLRKWH